MSDGQEYQDPLAQAAQTAQSQSSDTDAGGEADVHDSAESTVPEIKETDPTASDPYAVEQDASGESGDAERDAEQESDTSQDEYGNDKPKSRTYTEEEKNEEVNRAVRERLARLQKNNPQTQQDMAAQAQKDFEYNPESNETWQQQLAQFVEQTVTNMSTRQVEQQRAAQEQQAQQEFEKKFFDGMSRFSDFEQVVGSQPITDPMVYASRGLKDPAAFFYAASKRMPDELKRISQMDPYAQGLELGRLEQKMRKSKTSTNAPKPIEPTRSDTARKPQEKRANTIDDLIAQSDRQRLERMQGRRRR